MADDSMDPFFDAIDQHSTLENISLFDDMEFPTLEDIELHLFAEPNFNHQPSNVTSGVNDVPVLDIIGRPIEEHVFNQESNAPLFCNDNVSGGNQFFQGQTSGVKNIFNQENNASLFSNDNGSSGNQFFQGQTSGVKNSFSQENNARRFCNDNGSGGNHFFPGETSGVNQVTHERGAFTGFGNPRGIPVYPVPPVPFSCSCCQVLREITHANGKHFTKLEIHGRLGIIIHAILESRFTDPSSAPPQYQMFDFCKKSLEAVREMLVQYCEDRKQAGYAMLQDPLLTYYEALCIGIYKEDNDDFLNNFEDVLETSPLRSSSPVADDFQIIQPQPMNHVRPEINVAPRPKSSLAAQRGRTKDLTLRDFAECYSLTIEEAAKTMNVCSTVIKKICRKYGLERWPYRRIKSLERQISVKRKNLSACREEEGKRRLEAELQALERQLATIINTFYRS